jgi:hypothetical protein
MLRAQPGVHTGADVEYSTAGWVDWYNNRFTAARLPRLRG